MNMYQALRSCGVLVTGFHPFDVVLSECYGQKSELAKGAKIRMIKAALLGMLIGGEIVNLVMETGLVAKIVLLILLIFSVFSWAIILSKWTSLRRAKAQSARFLRAFRKAHRLQDIAAVSEQFRPSPLVAVFEGAYEEFRRQGDQNIPAVQRA